MAMAAGGEALPIKIVVVGDGNSGKTCLLHAYATKSFPAEYVPTVFDDYTAVIPLDGKAVNISLIDTAGGEEYEKLSRLRYPGTHCFILCFSVNSRPAYERVQQRWLPEIVHDCPGTPYILVGTKSDLRDDAETQRSMSVNGREYVEQQAVVEWAADSGVQCIECSALKQVNVDAVFEAAVRLGVNYATKPV